MKFPLSILQSRMDAHTLEVFNGALLAIVLRAIGAVLAFGLNVLIGRLLGAEGAGLYYLALAVVTIGAVVTKFGLDNALLRFISVGANSADWNMVSGVFKLGMSRAASTSILAAGAVFASAPWMSEHIFGKPELEHTLRVMSIGIFSFAMMTLLAESLKGLKRIRNSMLVSGVLYPLIAIVLIYPLASTFGAPGAATAFVLGTSLAATMGWIMWRANVSGVTVSSTGFDQVALWRGCRPLWVMSIINRAFVPWTPLFLLGIWGTPEEVGMFGAATRVAMLMTFFLTAVNTSVAPKFAELHQKGDVERLGKLNRSFALIITLAASPFLIILVFAGDWVMGLFGPEFVGAGAALSILALGHAINTMTGSVGYLLVMTGHEHDMRNASVVSFLLMLGCAITLVPSDGIIGAAISSALAIISTNVYASIILYRRMGIAIFRF